MHKYMSMILPANRKGPLFNGGRFSPLSFANVTTLCQLLHGTNEEPVNYASYSFRIGAATTAAAAGLPPALIKTLGHWKSKAYETCTIPLCHLIQCQAYLRTLMQATRSLRGNQMITLLEPKEQPLIAVISLSIRIVIFVPAQLP